MEIKRSLSCMDRPSEAALKRISLFASTLEVDIYCTEQIKGVITKLIYQKCEFAHVYEQRDTMDQKKAKEELS